jgi:hypothetical protein
MPVTQATLYKVHMIVVRGCVSVILCICYVMTNPRCKESYHMSKGLFVLELILKLEHIQEDLIWTGEYMFCCTNYIVEMKACEESFYTVTVLVLKLYCLVCYLT